MEPGLEWRLNLERHRGILPAGMNIVWFRRRRDKKVCLVPWLQGCRAPSFSEREGAFRSSSSTSPSIAGETEAHSGEVT